MTNGSVIRLRAVLVGAVVFILLTWHLNRVIQLDIWQALVFSGPLAAMPAFLVWWFSKRELKKTQARQSIHLYGQEADELYSKVLDQVFDILLISDRVQNPEMKEHLRNLAEHTEVFLTKIKEKKPDHRKTAATGIAGNLTLILEHILPQYLEMQDQPRYYPDAADKMTRANQAITNLESYILGSISILEKDDDVNFEVALKLIDPFERAFLF